MAAVNQQLFSTPSFLLSGMKKFSESSRELSPSYVARRLLFITQHDGFSKGTYIVTPENTQFPEAA